MGIQYTDSGGAFTRLQRTANAKYGRFLDDVASDMEDIMQDGATEMQHIIWTNGVRNTIPNDEGRYDTGKMHDAVEGRIRRTGDTIRGEFGWIKPSEREDYFGWQEDGTLDHGEPMGDPDPRPKEERSNRGIRPMLALATATEHAAEEVQRRLPRRNGRGA